MSKLFTIKGTNFRVTRDNYGNYQPEEYREVENKKEKTKSMKWVSSAHFHPNLGRALEEIIDTELYTGMPASIEVIEALNLYNQITKKIFDGCREAEGWV